MPVGPVARDERTADFLNGAAAGKFLLRKCAACQSVSAPQARQCGQCGSAELGWQPAAGGASVVSWAVTHTKPGEDGATRTAVIVIAELDEGPWWWSQVVDAAPDDIQVGTRLRIDFARADEESESVPVFRLAS
ncbi:MAG TPA: OB-fold domain-containing protein [Trebonia sp.]|jgi:uncharacterized OB-fold protein|nr:OB-fold domain-containing protein [Trebonia sp.]